jgi:hypothetical protein
MLLLFEHKKADGTKTNSNLKKSVGRSGKKNKGTLKIVINCICIIYIPNSVLKIDGAATVRLPEANKNKPPV